MSRADGTYDADELRALGVALEVLDPQDPDPWEGDADQFAASVRRGRERLERRGVATFARDGGAVVDSDDAGLLRAFLAPDGVIEAWIVDGTVALQREWYVGPKVTVVADPAAEAHAEEARDMTCIDSVELFADLVAFLDLRGDDVGGAPIRIDADALDDFRGHPVTPLRPDERAPRLVNVSATWAGGPPRALQLVDAGGGGLWLVLTVDDSAPTAAEDDPQRDEVELVPATWSEIVTRLLAAVTPDP